jgi:hypothetical protein
MKSRGWLVFILLLLSLSLVLWLVLGKQESMDKTQPNKAQVSEPQQKERRSTLPEATLSSAREKIAPTQKAGQSAWLEGRLVGHLRSDEVGHSEEAGGIGVAGISVGAQGQILVWDRYQDAFVIIDEHGGREVVYQMTKEDEYMKGATLGPDGEFVGLFGNTELTLVRQGLDGSFERIPMPFTPEYLNAFRVESVGDQIALYGVEENYLVGQDGTVTTFYGGLMPEQGLSFDLIMNDDQHTILTIRDSEAAPIKTIVREEVFGSVQGVYSLGGSRIAAVLESDPFVSDDNRENPHYTVQVINAQGDVERELRFPMKPGFPIDQPIAVRDGKVYYTVQHAGGELEVFEYPIP